MRRLLFSGIAGLCALAACGAQFIYRPPQTPAALPNYCTPGAVTNFYVDPDFDPGNLLTHNGSASNPWHSLNDSGAWSAVNGQLATTNVTVYHSARKDQFGGDVNKTSAQPLFLLRTDMSTHCLVLDGMAQYNNNSTTPSSSTWVAYDNGTTSHGQNSRYTITTVGGSPMDTENSDGSQRNYITVRGFGFVVNGDAMGMGAHIAFLGSTNGIFELNSFVMNASVTHGGPGLSIGIPSAVDNGNGTVTWTGIWNQHFIIRYNAIGPTAGECIYIGGDSPDPPPPSGSGSFTQNKQAEDDILLQGNVCTDSGMREAEGGIDLKSGNTNVRVLNNVVHQSQTPTNSSNCINGDVTATCTYCINAEAATVIDGNWCLVDTGVVNDGMNPAIFITSAWQNVIGKGPLRISNNIIAGWRAESIRLSDSFSAAKEWASIDVSNNTVYNGFANCLLLAPDYGSGFFFPLTYRNNICSSPAADGVNTPSTFTQSFTHDYNIFFNIGSGSALNLNGTITTCAGIATPEPHSKCVNPTFASAASPYVDTGFKVLSTSLARNAGLTLTAFNTDYGGQPRPGSETSWTIGAWQFK